MLLWLCEALGASFSNHLTYLLTYLLTVSSVEKIDYLTEPQCHDNGIVLYQQTFINQNWYSAT